MDERSAFVRGSWLSGWCSAISVTDPGFESRTEVDFSFPLYLTGLGVASIRENCMFV